MSMLGRTSNNVSKTPERRVPRIEPILEVGDALEADLRAKTQEVAEQVKAYAPALHPDRISATTRIMTDAIGKVAEDAAARIDARVAELDARVIDIKKGAVIFKEMLKQGAEKLSNQVELAMAQYEDLQSKMQESPFGPMPATVTKGPELPSDDGEKPDAA